MINNRKKNNKKRSFSCVPQFFVMYVVLTVLFHTLPKTTMKHAMHQNSHNWNGIYGSNDKITL